MAEPKKKVNTFRNIMIIIGVIIILLILLLLFWYFMKIKSSVSGDYSSYNYTNYTNDTSMENLEGDLPNANPQYTDSGNDDNTPVPDAGLDDAKREYKTSDKLSEITFTRVVDLVEEDLYTWKVNINIKVSGYLQEVDPATSKINIVLDRAYVFKDSKIDWDISGYKKNEWSEFCLTEYTDIGKGSKPIEELNEDTGDVKRGIVPIEGWGSWSLAYSGRGFYTDTPEISLEGHVLIPIVDTEKVTKLKDSAICGEYDNFVPITIKNFAIEPIFPLRLNNVDINQKSYSGNLEAENDAPEDHSDVIADATFEQSQFALPLNIPDDAPGGNWKVSWNINLP